MAFRSRVAALLRNLFRGGATERELDDELRAYVDMVVDDKRRLGLTPEQARRSALAELQGLEQVKERVRAVRAGALLAQVWRDVGYGLRIARRNPGFTLAAILTLALGIGAATATFTIVDTIVIRPLPYREPGRLVKIWASASSEPIDNVALAEFKDISDQNHVFAEVAADDGMDFTVLTMAGQRAPANGAIVTPQWLSTLGVQPILGRGFLPDEGQPGRDHVVILTDDYWRRRFNADPGVIGKTLEIDGTASTIVGVLPPNVLRYGADFLKPLVSATYPADRQRRDLDVVARLRPGATVASAQAEVDVIANRMASVYPESNQGRRFSVIPLEKYYALVDPKAVRGLTLMLGAVGVVLLIACVNVANLLTARAAMRHRECLVRTALGASRARLMSQLLVENVLLFVLGGALGILFASWSVDSMVALAVAEGYVPARMAVSIDARVLLFALSMSLATGLVFGLAPAVRSTRVDLNEGLRDASHVVGAGPGRGRTRRVLIVAELTLSLVLLIGFGLLIRSFLGLQSIGPGFDSTRLLETISDGGRSFPDAVAYWQTALDRAGAMPGVESVAVTSRPPLRGAREQRFAVEGLNVPAEDEPRAGDILVSAGYFRTLGIPLIAGRALNERDTHGSTPVVVISQTLAARFFPDQNPLGRRLRLGERLPMTCCSSGAPVENVWREIVGVVGDIRQANLDEQPAATIYRPFTQIVEHDMFLMLKVRSDADMTQVAANLSSVLSGAVPGSQWFDVRPTAQVINASESVRLRRFVLILLGAFATLALALAAVGLYGVMSYFVAERRREIAVRMALGATRSAVLAQVLSEAGRLVAAGLVLGGIAAHLLTRFISSLLFGINANDAPTYIGVFGVLGMVALLASYLPASRAAAIDPIVALKEP